ncbi:MAG: M23 family metallopeptidase [Dehalococcoidia bacterium]|nr:M23 family metallopeptidase [Dehalococcoidia bacterium]
MNFSVIAGLLGVIVFIGLFPVRVAGLPTEPVLNAQRFTLPGLAAAVPTAGAESLTSGPVPLTVLAPPVSLDAKPNFRDNTEVALAEMAEMQDNSSQAQASVDGGDTNEKIPIFWEYEVQAGDTLSGIADRFGIHPDYIKWNNVDVESSDAIWPGLILQIPSVEGIVHSVLVNETVTEIADKYEADWRDIVEFRANGLAGDPNNVQPGSLILVPGGHKVIPVAPPPTRPGSDVLPPPSDTGWTWPAQGMLSSPFGPAHPLGIDVAAPIGTAVHAATSGVVTFVGGNPCCSYGYHVIIDHGNGYETLYGHLSGFTVEPGQSVSAGEVVGYIGMTGRTTGPHVHFELRRNGVYQDPLGFLP